MVTARGKNKKFSVKKRRKGGPGNSITPRTGEKKKKGRGKIRGEGRRKGVLDSLSILFFFAFLSEKNSQEKGERIITNVTFHNPTHAVGGRRRGKSERGKKKKLSFLFFLASARRGGRKKGRGSKFSKNATFFLNENLQIL